MIGFRFQWTKYFGGQNFRRTKLFGGQNFRQQVRFSAVLSAEILSDKVWSLLFRCHFRIYSKLKLIFCSLKILVNFRQLYGPCEGWFIGEVGSSFHNLGSVSNLITQAHVIKLCDSYAKRCIWNKILKKSSPVTGFAGVCVFIGFIELGIYYVVDVSAFRAMQSPHFVVCRRHVGFDVRRFVDYDVMWRIAVNVTPHGFHDVCLVGWNKMPYR